MAYGPVEQEDDGKEYTEMPASTSSCLNLSLKTSSSSLVRVSAFPITGITFTLSWSWRIVSTSICLHRSVVSSHFLPAPETVAGGSQEVEAGVDKCVRRSRCTLHPSQVSGAAKPPAHPPGLLVETLLEPLLDVIHHRSPALPVVQEISEPRTVNLRVKCEKACFLSDDSLQS